MDTGTLTIKTYSDEKTTIEIQKLFQLLAYLALVRIILYIERLDHYDQFS